MAAATSDVEARLLALENMLMQLPIGAIEQRLAAAEQSIWQDEVNFAFTGSQLRGLRLAMTVGAIPAATTAAGVVTAGKATDVTFYNMNVSTGVTSVASTNNTVFNWFPTAIPAATPIYAGRTFNDDGTEAWVVPSQYCP